jgi:hypothetical protein
LDATLPPVIDLGSKIAEFGRGERDSPFLTQARPPLRLINRTQRREMAVAVSA